MNPWGFTERELKNEEDLEKLKVFLSSFDLVYEDSVDYTILILDNENEIIAAGSLFRNILKGLAVNQDYQGDQLIDYLVSHLISVAKEKGYYHYFIFTSPQMAESFKYLGFNEIARAEQMAVLLEYGNQNIENYYSIMKEKTSADYSLEGAGIVVNCNPFTNGHRYLIEYASQREKRVHVFVLEEDLSTFPFETRLMLVREGTKDLGNVFVHPGGSYIISSAIFPAYFLKTEDAKTLAQAKLDVKIFANYVMRIFNLSARYVGEEPYCMVTSCYNKAMMEELLPLGKKLIIIPRKQISGEVISASHVRKALRENDFTKIASLVPETTLKFLKSAEAKYIIEKLKNKESRH
ncbi:MAG: [citrate (pro-3S)-lyase] ligase [Candidatus Coatesbacteria bacterium]|nr:[citrate (pro-3S)-lyase] ligase [Candidatus Coatesbacteria bacterium]